MPDETTELFLALGRIEERVRFTSESQERMEKKIDAQDARLNQVELDVKELKTQRENKSGLIVMTIAIASVVISVVGLLLQQ